MKKLLSCLMTFIILISVVGISPVKAQAKTTEWVDMNFAKSNIEDLKDYIYIYGNIDSQGNYYINYNYENFNFYITYVEKSDLLDFYASFQNGNYVDMYYSYYDLTPDVQVLFDSFGAKAEVTFDCTEYDYQDLEFYIKDSFGSISYSEAQDFCNLLLQAAIEGWDNCLCFNTPFKLCNIGFNLLCSHKLTTTYTPATFSSDGEKIEYCYNCGYNTETTYASIGQIKLSATKYTYDGKVKKPSVSVKDADGKTISSSNYSVKYQSGRKLPGKYSVTVNFVNGKYKGRKTLCFTIVPKSTALSTISAKSKGFTVKWKKQSTQTTGYQIQYATDSKFTKNKKTVTFSSNKTTSKTVSKLNSKKKYYVRIRTYKTVNGTNYYSSWSKSKTVTTKK